MRSSELRKDYIQDKYVIIAPQRGKRPYEVDKKLPSANVCHFCPAQIDKEPYILEVGYEEAQPLPRRRLSLPTSTPWQIKVVPNKYPAVSTKTPKAYGIQEVVVETSKHGARLENLSIAQITKLLLAYAARTQVISQDKKIEYILIFKNEGGPAGASIGHAHSQIFATEFLPPHLMDKSQKIQAYKLKTGHCVYCDVIKKERKSSRFVWEDKDVIAFTPYASLHNYEIWILPKRHLDNITTLNNQELQSWANILRKILKKIAKLNLSYNYYFHQVINDKDQHLYMKITPRGSVWAGVEIGSGLIINPITPEDAARYYRA